MQPHRLCDSPGTCERATGELSVLCSRNLRLGALLPIQSCGWNVKEPAMRSLAQSQAYWLRSRAPTAVRPLHGGRCSSRVGVAAPDAPAVLPPLSFDHRPALRDGTGRLLLKNLTLPELEEFCESIGEPPRQAQRVWRALYAGGRWACTLDQLDEAGDAFGRAFKVRHLTCVHRRRGWRGWGWASGGKRAR